MFFKEIVQEDILFGSEMWVLNPRMGRAQGSFQHRFDRRIMGTQLKQWEDRSLYYPPLDTVMEEAVFEEIIAYVLNR